jgi:N-acetylmuramoyl-L-alanine amidase
MVVLTRAARGAETALRFTDTPEADSPFAPHGRLPTTMRQGSFPTAYRGKKMFTLSRPPSPMAHQLVRQLVVIPLCAVLAPVVLPAGGAAGQVAHSRDGAVDASKIRTVLVERRRGFPAAWVGALDAWGWSLTQEGDSAVAQRPDGSRVSVRAGTRTVQANTGVIELSNAPYMKDEVLFVPLQLVFELGGWPVESDLRTVRLFEAPDPQKRLVVIDPGHGGGDPGVAGAGGTLEKDLTLSMAIALADALSADPGYEVHLTRHGDVYVPLEDRGSFATALKGQRPGVFISLHAISNPDSPTMRGFESYFLAEAETARARRVAEIENAPAVEHEDDDSSPDRDVSSVMNRFPNPNQDHWSARLAEMVQSELATAHSGPNRGVAQAPLAVLGNALMPSVLVAVGFVSNQADESLLSDSSFRAEAAESLARAVGSFFDNYPPARAWAAAGGSD